MLKITKDQPTQTYHLFVWRAPTSYWENRHPTLSRIYKTTCASSFFPPYPAHFYKRSFSHGSTRYHYITRFSGSQSAIGRSINSHSYRFCGSNDSGFQKMLFSPPLLNKQNDSLYFPSFVTRDYYQKSCFSHICIVHIIAEAKSRIHPFSALIIIHSVDILKYSSFIVFLNQNTPGNNPPS